MIGTTTLPSRYPGIVAFDEKQHSLFFGRSREKKELLQMLKNERTIVLFAKSGVGKSSLINAGLIPYMQEDGFYPIKIRFQYTESGRMKTPLQILHEVISYKIKKEGTIQQRSADILFDKEKPRLWELFKVLEFPVYEEKKGINDYLVKELLEQNTGTAANEVITDKISRQQIPVLIFDQFEEFFNFPIAQQHDFLAELAELLHEMCPNRILEWLRSFSSASRTEEMIMWSKQPIIKCIFAIRGDKLAELDSLRRYIPLILRNRYRLGALNTINAREAVTGPASLSDQEFISPPFKIDKLWLQAVLNKLTGNQKTPNSETSLDDEKKYIPETGIDGSQLQKICSYIEQKVTEKKTPGLVVNEDTIGILDVEKVLDSFYEDQLMKIGKDQDIALCRKIIEDHLVAGGGRTSLTEGQITELLGNNTHLLEKMMEVRLVKEEFTHLGKTFELSHDTLVRAVTKYAIINKEKRLESEKKILEIQKKTQSRYTRIFVLLTLFIFLLFIYVLNTSRKATKYLNKSLLQQGQAYYNSNNHRTAFRIWSNNNSFVLFDRPGQNRLSAKLDSSFFYDISGGKRIEWLPPNHYVVQENQMLLNIYTITPGQENQLQVKSYTDLKLYAHSSSNNYLLCKNSKSKLIIYDVVANDTFSIAQEYVLPKQFIKDVGKGKVPDYDPEEEPGIESFVGANDFIWFKTKRNVVTVYDLKNRRPVNINLMITSDDPSESMSSATISPDGKLMAFSDTTRKDRMLIVYDISNPRQPVLREKTPITTLITETNSNESIVYKHNDSIYFSSYKDGWRHTASKRDKLQRIFSFRERKCIIYMSDTTGIKICDIYGNIITRIADYNRTYITNPDFDPRRQYTLGLSLSNGILTYVNNARILKSYNLLPFKEIRTLRVVRGVSPNREYYIRLDSIGHLSIRRIDNNQIIFPFGGENAIMPKLVNYGIVRPQCYFNPQSTIIAYLRDSSDGHHYLEAVALDKKEIIHTQRIDNSTSLLSFDGEKNVMLENEEDNIGIIILNNQKRTQQYFNKLYPHFTDAEKKILDDNL